MIFDVENSLWKSIFAIREKMAKLGKASWDAYNQGGWLTTNFILPFEKLDCQRCLF